MVASLLRQAERFTARELQVTRLIAEGCINKEIAGSTGVSLRALKTHPTAAMLKAGVRAAPGLVRYAIKHGLIGE